MRWLSIGTEDHMRTIGVQVNRMTMATIQLPEGASEQEAVAVARSAPAIARHLTAGNVTVEKYKVDRILCLAVPRVSA